MDINLAEKLYFKSAAEFYNTVSDYRDYPSFVFRGQGCSTYALEPGIIRNSRYLNEFYGIGGTILTAGNNFKKYEYELLRCFIKGCDRAGINIPNDGHSLRQSFDLVSHKISIPFAVNFENFDVNGNEPPNSWPNQNDYSVMIMAQHHGVPTRLLDWSGSILTAMYFASVSGMEKIINMNDEEISKKRIAVWGLNGESLNNNYLLYGFALIKPPTSLSVNISPQEGFFTTYISTPENRDSYIINHQNVAKDCLKVFYFDLKESMAMYEICRKHGHTGALLFPGADGASKEVKEVFMYNFLKKRFAL